MGDELMAEEGVLQACADALDRERLKRKAAEDREKDQTAARIESDEAVDAAAVQLDAAAEREAEGERRIAELEGALAASEAARRL